MTYRKSWDWYYNLDRDDRIAVGYLATSIAKKHIKIGDRVSRSLCGGGRGTFTITNWDGVWMCGKTVYDCHASSVLKVNGVDVDFLDMARHETRH